MNIHEFFERFLPDYEAKVLPYEMSKHVLCNEAYFQDEYFPEALQNFADRICEKQRENCANSVAKRCVADRIALENAKQPENEEL